MSTPKHAKALLAATIILARAVVKAARRDNRTLRDAQILRAHVATRATSP